MNCILQEQIALDNPKRSHEESQKRSCLVNVEESCHLGIVNNHA